MHLLHTGSIQGENLGNGVFLLEADDELRRAVVLRSAGFQRDAFSQREGA